MVRLGPWVLLVASIALACGGRTDAGKSAQEKAPFDRAGATTGGALIDTGIGSGGSSAAGALTDTAGGAGESTTGGALTDAALSSGGAPTGGAVSASAGAHNGGARQACYRHTFPPANPGRIETDAGSAPIAAVFKLCSDR